MHKKMDNGYGGILIVGDINEKEMNDFRAQAMLKPSRHNNKSIFKISQYFYELFKKMIRVNGNICQVFKPNTYRDVQNFYQDKASMDLTPSDFIYLTFTCWIKK